MKTSLCMIVKNEANTIGKAIGSVASIVSEIVVGVDKASFDGTKEIVERMATKTIDIDLSRELKLKKSVDGAPDWGFSKARNAVFDAADPDAWRIILDGHETVRDAEKFASAIAAAAESGCDGVDVTVYFEPAADGIPQTAFESARAMAPGVRYVNPQHNAAVLKKKYKARGVIVEHRKQDQAKESRQERDMQRFENVAGFEKTVKIKPKNSRTWFYLATAYKESGRYGEAANAFEVCLVHSRWNEERWHARMDIGHCMLALNKPIDARDSYIAAIDEQPERAEAHFHIGDLAYKHGRLGEAEAWLEKCVSMPMPTCRLFLNVRIYMVTRHDLLSMVYHHVGKYRKAIEQAEIALKAAPNERISKNVDIWKRRVEK